MVPFLFWVGGKRALAPTLAGVYRAGKCKRLLEPFAGSAALFHYLEPKRAVLSDKNDALIDYYLTLQRTPKLLARAWLGLNDAYPQPSADHYYLVREVFNDLSRMPTHDAIEAAYFLYLNRMGFQGMWRTNAGGGMNTPYGHRKVQRLPGRADIIAASKLLQRASIEHCDFEKTVDQAGVGDFLYCDPPYYKTYDYSTGFDRDDHDRLEYVAHQAKRRGAVVVLSNSDTKVVRRIYSQRRWEIISISNVQRLNAGKVKKRRGEVIIVGKS